MLSKRNKLDKIDIAFVCLLFGGLLLYLSRIRCGFADLDESFYLTIPYRLVQGDGLLKQEWHLTQLYSVLVYPILKLFLFINGSTDGIYLSFRYIYLLLQFSVTGIGYLLLRKRDKIAALASCMIFFMYTIENMTVVSYNTLGLMTLWLWIVISLHEGKHTKIQYILLGIILAANVLCDPYMLFAYIIYMFFCIWKRDDGLFGLKAFLYVTIGSIIVFLVFCAFVLSRASFAEVLRNLPYIFDDPCHVHWPLSSYFDSIIWLLDWFKPYFIAMLLGGAAAVIWRKWSRLIFSGLCLLSMLFGAVLVYFKSSGIGRYGHMLPLTLLGLLAFLLTKKKDWEIFQKGWVVGVIFAMSMNFCSDQGVYAICWSSTVPSAFSIFLIKDYLEEQEDWNWKWYGFAFLIAAQLGCQIYQLTNYAFWEDVSPRELTSEIEEGPLRGILTTEEKKNYYDINYHNLKNLGNLEGKNILMFKDMPCGYLIAESARSSGYTSWFDFCDDMNEEKLVKFYELYPEKEADIIYLHTWLECGWNDEEWEQWCEENGYRKIDFPEGGSALCKN